MAKKNPQSDSRENPMDASNNPQSDSAAISSAAAAGSGATAAGDPTSSGGPAVPKGLASPSGRPGSTPRPYSAPNRRGGRRGPGGGFGGGHRGAPVEKAKDFKGSLRKLLHYIGRYKVALVFVIIFAIISTVFSIVGPKILGNATTTLFTGIMSQIAGTGTGPDFDSIGRTLGLLLILYFISAAFQFAQGFIMAGVSNNISFRLRKDIDEKISRLPLAYFDKVPIGDVMSHITNDVDAIQQNLSQSITQVITSATTLIGILVMMFSINWIMTLIAIITLPISIGVVILIVSHSQKHFINQQLYLGEVNGLVEENYGAHTIVKAFNAENRATSQFNESNSRLYNSAWRANFLSGLMMPIMNIISNLGYVAVCIVGAYLAISGSITVGDIQAFIQYTRNFQQPIVQLSQISNIMQQTLAGAERIFEFLEEKELVPEASADEATSLDQIHGGISFENVRFGYDSEKPIIHDFSTNVRPGQKIAIVGKTGAGKTTLVKLMMRFYDVDSGAICVDGHDIRSFRRNDLRSIFGMVLQDTWLFNGSIADNIRYGKLDATDEEVRQAAQIAQADHFIRTLPDSYRMVLDEETSNISAGQKQLLTIARAVLHDPQVLILDEATSSIDTRTELLIQTAMDNLMVGRTSFIIAHRLSTVKNADLILVIDNGDIVEQGSHNQLLAQGGYYATLYNSQFDLEEELAV